MTAWKYFVTLLKRIRNLFPIIFCITALLAVTLAYVGSTVLDSLSNSEERQKVRIGVVGNVEGTYMDIGFSAIKHLDTSRFSVDLVETDEKDARKQILDGQMIGYVKIPDTLIYDMSCGNKCEIEFFTKNNASGFGSTVITEIAKTDSQLILKTQGAIFAAGDIARENGIKNNGSFMDELSIKYITLVLGRSDFADVEILGISDKLSLSEYYVCGAIVLFMLLWGISCCELLFKDDATMHKLLCKNNINPLRQFLCEYGVYLIATTAMLALVFIIGAEPLAKNGITESVGMYEAVRYLTVCIPAIMLFTSFQMLVYECISSRVAVITFQVVFAIIFGYLSGCFYPEYFFPETMQKIMNVLPVGVGFSYFKEAMNTGVSSVTALLTLGYCIAFSAFTVMARKIKTAGDGQ